MNTFIFWCMVNPLNPHSVYAYQGGHMLCKSRVEKANFIMADELGFWL